MYCNEKFVISQVGEALEEDLSSGGVEGTQLLAHQYIQIFVVRFTILA